MIVEAPMMAALGGPTECAACQAVVRGVAFEPGTPFYAVDAIHEPSRTILKPCGHVFKPRDGAGWDCDEDDRVDWGQVAIERGIT